MSEKLRVLRGIRDLDLITIWAARPCLRRAAGVFDAPKLLRRAADRRAGKRIMAGSEIEAAVQALRQASTAEQVASR